MGANAVGICYSPLVQEVDEVLLMQLVVSPCENLRALQRPWVCKALQPEYTDASILVTSSVYIKVIKAMTTQYTKRPFGFAQ